MNVETIPITDISQDPANVRKHSQRNIEAIAASLRASGQQTPIVIDRRNIVIKGNGTLAAAKLLGWNEIQVVRTELTGVGLTAYAIADNRTAELAEWDDLALVQILNELKNEDYDIELTGFSESDFQIMMKEIGDNLINNTDIVEDDVPDVPEEQVITKPGDVWILGKHRLLCGDSSILENVEKLFGNNRADMLLTDPPYGVSYVGKTEEALEIENDKLDESALNKLLVNVFNNAQKICREGAYWYGTGPSGPIHLIFAEDWKRRGILRQVMVWAKDSMVLGHSEYHYKHEPIFFGWIPGGKRHVNSDRTRTSVWEVPRPKASREHPTMKPVELWAIAIRDGSIPDEIVYDPFLGSGTTIIASEQLGRRAYGMELSPHYCDVIVKRWENLTGLVATRDQEVIS